MVSSRGLITAVALSAISMAFLWFTRIPLGVPGEWTWERISVAGNENEFVLGAAQGIIAGVVYILLAWLGSRRVGTCSRLELTGWLFGIATVGFGWLLAVQEAPPSGWRMSKAAFVLYYPGSSGYFHKARYDISDSAEFLRDYEGLMAEGDVLHVGTHPPGLFLLYRGCINALSSQPQLARLITDTAPTSVTEAFDLINVNLLKTGNELTTTDRAVIWLVAVLTQLCCVLAVLPIFTLIRQSCSREISWRAVTFWPLIPALAIFIPKSDVLFVLPGILLVCCWMVAARRQSFLLGALAGAIGWFGLFCSLAFLPIGLIAFVASLLMSTETLADSKPSNASSKSDVWKSLNPAFLWKPLSGGVLAIGALTLIMHIVYETNLCSIWVHNYRNHAAFYSQFSRSMWKWLLVNPLELIFAAGMPVAFLSARASYSLFQLRWDAVKQPLSVSFLAVWTLLWLSGKNSGEAARLWIPLLPILLTISASGLVNKPDKTESVQQDDSASERSWLLLLSCQAIVCLATVMRVSGFHF